MGAIKFGGGILVMAVAAAAYMTPTPDGPFEVFDPKANAIGARYEVLRAGRETGCFVSKGEQIASGKAALEIDPGCGEDFSDYAKARYWNEEADGTVALVAEDGSVALRLAASDGHAFEAYGSGVPLIALTDATY
jgi:hypothetical protein